MELLVFLQETFTLLVLLSVVSAYSPISYCEGDTFEAKCEPDEVVVMTNASYGRMNLGKCLRVDYGNMGCYSNVLSIFDTMCSGRRTCRVRVTSILDMMKNKPHPCPGDLRSYLEATYKCVKVGPSSRPVCGREAHMVLNSTSGYLASVVTEETQAGSIRCPWVIKGHPGQRVNITMYDFAASRSPTSSSLFVDCSSVYATVKEPGIMSTHRICNGDTRISRAYMSFTDTVEVRIFTEEESQSRKYFILHYQILGCKDLKPPPNSILERNGDKLKMRCNGSSASQWSELKCVDYKWVGEKVVCPASVNAASSTDAGVGETLWQFITGRHEFSIVIIASVAIIIASAVLTVGLLCIKRRRENMIRLAQRKYEEGSIYYAEGRKGDPRVMSHNTQGMPDPYTANENDYFRTWQLQRHAQARSPIDMDYPSNTVRPRDEPNKFGFGYGHVDHIYESPKFDRRDVQYFELDPTVCHQGDPCPIPENSARNYPLPAPPR